MYTLQIQDETVYRRLMHRVEQEQTTLDAVLSDLLGQESPSDEQPALETTETPAQKLVRLIDEANLSFKSSFNARDADDILREEAGKIDWRTPQGESQDA
jgi:hypothetical protein